MYVYVCEGHLMYVYVYERHVYEEHSVVLVECPKK